MREKCTTYLREQVTVDRPPDQTKKEGRGTGEVPVLTTDGRLFHCRPGTARRMLKKGEAVVHTEKPFVLKLKSNIGK